MQFRFIFDAFVYHSLKILTIIHNLVLSDDHEYVKLFVIIYGSVV